MAGTTESSVMFALSELQRIERERISEEAAAELERRRKEEERRRREREEREQAEAHRLRVAEAEARLRVAEEGRLAEAADRAARLTAELESMQSERSALSERLSSMEAGSAARAGRTGRWYWAAGMLIGCVSVTAAAGARSGKRAQEPEVVTVIKTAPAPAVLSSDPADAKRIAELEARLNKLLERPRPRPLPGPVHVPAARPAASGSSATAGSLLAQMGDCEKDPLCGVKLSKKEGGK